MDKFIASFRQFVASYSPQIHVWVVGWAAFSAAYITSPVLQAQVAALQSAAHLPAATFGVFVGLVNLTNAYVTLSKSVEVVVKPGDGK